MAEVKGPKKRKLLGTEKVEKIYYNNGVKINQLGDSNVVNADMVKKNKKARSNFPSLT